MAILKKAKEDSDTFAKSMNGVRPVFLCHLFLWLFIAYLFFLDFSLFAFLSQILTHSGKQQSSLYLESQLHPIALLFAPPPNSPNANLLETFRKFCVQQLTVLGEGSVALLAQFEGQTLFALMATLQDGGRDAKKGESHEIVYQKAWEKYVAASLRFCFCVLLLFFCLLLLNLVYFSYFYAFASFVSFVLNRSFLTCQVPVASALD
jgi:hypothetical protein